MKFEAVYARVGPVAVEKGISMKIEHQKLVLSIESSIGPIRFISEVDNADSLNDVRHVVNNDMAAIKPKPTRFRIVLPGFVAGIGESVEDEVLLYRYLGMDPDYKGLRELIDDMLEIQSVVS